MENFATLYQNKVDIVDKYLSQLFPEISIIPEPLYSAMKYSVIGGGKRFRPVLMLATAEMFNPEINEVMSLSAAIELIHCYSLIHDDLPCMDDDSLRRGRPTNHMIYGEGMALLAGDALLNMAFEHIFETSLNSKDVRKYVKAGSLISRCAGAKGMIGGQCADLSAEARDTVTEKDLNYVHTHKTGRMIEAAILGGAILGGAREEEEIALKEYGKNIGLAFQIADDILDILGDAKALGKSVGSDLDKDKLTFPKIYGIEKSKLLCDECIETAINSLEIFGDKAEFMRDLAKFVVNRGH